MLEIIFKIVFTIIGTVIYLTSLFWIWTSQVDLRDTFLGFLKSNTSKQVDWIATRDSNTIYQEGKVVGNISGDVKEIEDKIIFNEICNTSGLNRNLPFEYKRLKLRIISIENAIGVYSNGTEVKHSVIQNVICEKSK